VGIYGETVDISSKFFRRLNNDQKILTQAIIMRLSTRRGLLWTDPEYGLPITNYVNEGLTQDSLARIPSEVQAELEKDERVATVAVGASVSTTSQGSKLVLDLKVTPNEGPEFQLVLAVSALTLELLTQGAG
jgi:phage baseplate assembly protein W